ncbi:uncharacterized protein taf1c [Polymixia lowei]
MQNFYVDNYQDAFGSMGSVLEESFYFEPGKRKKDKTDAVHLWRASDFMDKLKYKKCEYSYLNSLVRSYGSLLSDVIHDIPPELLADLLSEELAEQRDRLQFSEATTGGALAYIPFTQSGSSGPQHGCLIYPGNQGLSRLNFHKVELQFQEGRSPCLDARGNKPSHFLLKGPVRQISSVSLLTDCCVGVRSDHLCGVWKLGETVEPHLLQVINTREPATCINVSPHVLGEVLVASESGAAHLWTVGRGMQKFREEDSNLYFNARSPWRWCEFSAHPRVMVYADRTGTELTDVRIKGGSGFTLFRIGQGPECRSGERVILTKYLGQAHSFHHLVTTQFSAYIVDERFPCMPMLKWDHMMQYPPMFGHVLPGSASSCSAGGGTETTKILLGSQSSQEISMLQYSGGRAEACFSVGPPLALLTPGDSLKHLAVQLPHRHSSTHTRLSLPAAGLTCIQQRGGGGGGGGGEECICVLQLTDAGDIFYQILKPEHPATDATRRQTQTQPPSKEMTSGRKPAARDKTFALHPLSQATVPRSQQLVMGTSSDEDEIIGPTQARTGQGFISETPEKEQPSADVGATGGGNGTLSDASGTSSEESESERPRRNPAHWGLEVVVNDEPEPDRSGLVDKEHDTSAVEKTSNANNAGVTGVAHQDVEENVVVPADRPAPVKLSHEALVTWKCWLQKLVKKNRRSKLKSRGHQRIKTERLLKPASNRDPMEEDRLHSLRRDLRECMTNGSLLVHGATYLQTLEPVPVPTTVDPAAWPDDLSQRLTLSWRGEQNWRDWWTENLGLNMEERLEALRKKRLRQKEARRSRQRVEYSGSFTSSVSYQSDMDDLSSTKGWSSATSQAAWSDDDGFWSRRDDATDRTTTPTAEPSAAPWSTPQQGQQGQERQSIPGSSQHLSLSRTAQPVLTQEDPSPQRRPKRSLGSPFVSQEEPAGPQRYVLEDGGTVNTNSQVLASSSQLHSSLLPSQRSVGAVSLPRVGLSQSFSPSQSSQSRPGLSQSFSPSQSSQSRPGLSQSFSPSQSSQSRPGLSQSFSPSQSSQSRPGLSQSFSLSQSSQSRPGLSKSFSLPQSSQSRPGLSKSFSLSQSSQSRPGLSQSSQPKRKKSRMGF